MQQRKVGTFNVGAIGLGCMNLCHAYGKPASNEQAERVLLTALDHGITFFDTAALYGFGLSEMHVGNYLSKYRQRFTLASKCGMQGVDVNNDGKLARVIDGRPDTLKKTCEDSLRRLRTDVIDLYYLHRWDKRVPIEDSVGALSDLVRAGKIQSIGLSEVSAATLKKAHAVHPIAAVQTEYSLWTRNPEIAVLQACQELGAAFVAFSPVARGFLCGKTIETTTFDDKDIRKAMPRFQPDHFQKNLSLLPPFEALAKEIGCTPSQLALAWLVHKAPYIIPIPGTNKVEHVIENSQACEIVLSKSVMKKLESIINQNNVSGNRYNEQSNREVDTEVY
jgi:aryl-alcohol dehydrogenase-like predicted oxidoreductase